MIQEPVKKGLRMFRQSRTYRDHHRYCHYDRTELDRQTAAMLLTCWSSITVPGTFPVSDIMYAWECQKRHWELEIQPVAGRLFTIGDFVTYLLCMQEQEDGETLRNYRRPEMSHYVDIVQMQEQMDEVMRDVERDLQLAGFLAVTNEQLTHRKMSACQPI